MFTFVHSSDISDVLEAARIAEPLAQLSGQSNVLARTQFQLAAPYFGAKLPHALLVYGPDRLLHAAVFVLEYRFLGWRSGIFVPSDSEGDLTVIALPEHRLDAARRATEYLLGAGARLTYICLLGDSSGAKDLSFAFTVRNRDLRRTLALRSTVDETLAQMGRRSRRNLRHAARLATNEVGATLHPDAAISEGDVVAFNQLCDFRVPDAVARSLYRNAQAIQGCFISGLRSRNGDWLSLLGGRRLGQTSIVDWQMNRADLGRISIGTAMRLFQISHEINAGATALQFTGGTPHSMQNGFTRENVTDLLSIRDQYSSRSLLLLIRALIPPTNGLRQLLPSTLSGFEG